MKKAMIILLCLITLMSVLPVSAYSEGAAPDDWNLKTEDLPQAMRGGTKHRPR